MKVNLELTSMLPYRTSTIDCKGLENNYGLSARMLYNEVVVLDGSTIQWDETRMKALVEQKKVR